MYTKTLTCWVDTACRLCVFITNYSQLLILMILILCKELCQLQVATVCLPNVCVPPAPYSIITIESNMSTQLFTISNNIIILCYHLSKLHHRQWRRCNSTVLEGVSTDVSQYAYEDKLQHARQYSPY